MMVIFFQAARLAMVKFDPLLSSREFANSILNDPPGPDLSSITAIGGFPPSPFTPGCSVLLLDGRWNNLEYGSNAPNAPDVILDDSWQLSGRSRKAIPQG